MADIIDKVVALYRVWDNTVSNSVYAAFEAVGFHEMQRDQPVAATAHLPWVSSPTPCVTAILAYLAIILTSVAYQKAFNIKAYEKDPLWLRMFVQLHNVALIALSAYMSASSTYYALFKYKYSLWGNSFVPSQTDLAHTVWVFYISKIAEFNDTFIMLLKRKLNQVSFLHVYHHTTISFIWWAISYAAPGGDAWYSVMLNSLVHVIMYTYYFVAAILGKDEKRKRKYLWWGRYLTQFQMFQFVTMMVQGTCGLTIMPGYPPFLNKLLVGYMITLLTLFGNFYVQKHIKGAAKRKAA